RFTHEFTGPACECRPARVPALCRASGLRPAIRAALFPGVAPSHGSSSRQEAAPEFTCLMIREHHRPLLPEERPRIERSLRRARFGGLLLPLGRFFGLMALWLMGLVIANAAAAWTAPGA